MIDFDYMILRLFILRIGKGKTDAEYRVAYGARVRGQVLEPSIYN